ncbi:unnamed protein product [Parascedosporium putredinis]|uniref:Stc1 domain-containing protein n=1 Tax=Parascedosporium putredinis TaxID=1442378 RepID=A0A9P1H8S5_9PEZI|nr:unnamed protein product [Parascedosporium putredinis]CAI7999622.1 unnamed protein product [Parascedosporium putredinis]
MKRSQGPHIRPMAFGSAETQIEEILGAELFRCAIGNELKPRRCFSNTQWQLFERKVRRGTGNRIHNVRMTCRSHSTEPRLERLCEGPCHRILPLTKFSKNTRVMGINEDDQTQVNFAVAGSGYSTTEVESSGNAETNSVPSHSSLHIAHYGPQVAEESSFQGPDHVAFDSFIPRPLPSQGWSEARLPLSSQSSLNFASSDHQGYSMNPAEDSTTNNDAASSFQLGLPHARSSISSGFDTAPGSLNVEDAAFELDSQHHGQWPPLADEYDFMLPPPEYASDSDWEFP